MESTTITSTAPRRLSLTCVQECSSNISLVEHVFLGDFIWFDNPESQYSVESGNVRSCHSFSNSYSLWWLLWGTGILFPDSTDCMSRACACGFHARPRSSPPRVVFYPLPRTRLYTVTHIYDPLSICAREFWLPFFQRHTTRPHLELSASKLRHGSSWGHHHRRNSFADLALGKHPSTLHESAKNWSPHRNNTSCTSQPVLDAGDPARWALDEQAPWISGRIPELWAVHLVFPDQSPCFEETWSCICHR